jgi:hypothetical protein
VGCKKCFGLREKVKLFNETREHYIDDLRVGDDSMALSFDERASASPYVDRIWRSYSERDGSFTSIAAVHWELVVTKYRGKTTMTLRGPETKATRADFPAEAEWFGIDFKLGAFMPHLPPGNVVNLKDIRLPEVTSTSFWLHSSAWEFPSYENADTFVDRLVRQGLLIHDPVVQAALQGHPQDISVRSVQYHFLHSTDP